MSLDGSKSGCSRGKCNNHILSYPILVIRITAFVMCVCVYGRGVCGPPTDTPLPQQSRAPHARALRAAQLPPPPLGCHHSCHHPPWPTQPCVPRPRPLHARALQLLPLEPLELSHLLPWWLQAESLICVPAVRRRSLRLLLCCCRCSSKSDRTVAGCFNKATTRRCNLCMLKRKRGLYRSDLRVVAWTQKRG